MAIDKNVEMQAQKQITEKNFPERRVTSFSIDDILSSRRSDSKESDKKDRSPSSVKDAGTKWRSQFDDIVSASSLWNREAQSFWLENLWKFRPATALQPLWLSYFQSDVIFRDSYSHLPGFSPYNPYNILGRPEKEKVLKSIVFLRQKNKRNRRNSSPHSNDDLENKQTLLDLVRQSDDSRICGGKSACSSVESESELSASNHSDSDSPLSALERLTCSTFKVMEKNHNQLHAVASGRDTNKVKQRKCRTAFTSFQLSILEQRFNRHKYLTPNDRDQIAQVLGLSSSQVITWFQNRRAKQKRDLEEMRKDIKTVSSMPQKRVLVAMADFKHTVVNHFNQ